MEKQMCVRKGYQSKVMQEIYQLFSQDTHN